MHGLDTSNVSSRVESSRAKWNLSLSFAFELILLKVGVLYTPDCEWTRAQSDCMLTAVGARDFL